MAHESACETECIVEQHLSRLFVVKCKVSGRVRQSLCLCGLKSVTDKGGRVAGAIRDSDRCTIPWETPRITRRLRVIPNGELRLPTDLF